jgi:hypothetical protein
LISWTDLDPGSQADWVQAIGTTLALVFLAAGLWRERRLRRIDQKQRARDQTERDELRRSEHARLVGAHIDQIDVIGDHDVIEMTVTNASPLPVRNVIGYLHPLPSGRVPADEVRSFLVIPVVRSGTEITRLQVPSAAAWRLVIDFDDDAGDRWRKYDGPLGRIADAPGPPAPNV